jgi:uroporphyrinogen III methyltransferase/synthase
MERGIVSFVGLGPNDPALRTARAVERVAQADVIVDTEDDATASRLIALAREGKRVVRAISGDPLESQHAIEEVREVARAGVSFEVVPGIGSAASAASFAGVVGRAVRVAMADLADLLEKEPPEAPVTLVVRAGEAAQRVIVSTVRGVPHAVRDLGAAHIIVAFGTPEEPLCWFEKRPLFGKRVLVTRAQGQNAGTADLLRDSGAEPLVVPTIVIGPPADPRPLERALGELRRGGYSWVAFTSANGVERTWEALCQSGLDARAFGAAHVAAIGPATARALERHGLRADVVAKEYRGEGLADEMLRAQAGQVGQAEWQNRTADEHGSASTRVLLARAARARDALPEALRAAGWAVDVVAAYETHAPPHQSVDALVRELEAGRVDAVTFTSSSTVDNLCDLLGNDRAAELLSMTRIASIGPLTTQAALARGLRVDVTAAKYTVPELVRALSESWAR